MLHFTENKVAQKSSCIIGRIGVEVSHEKDFTVDRPHGSGDHVFINFTSPVLLLSSEGKQVEKTGTFIIYAPPHPQWYTASENSFSHDWFHSDGTLVKELIRNYDIPANTPIHVPQYREFTDLFKNIYFEIYRKEPYWEKNLPMLLEQLVIALKRATCRKEDLMSRHLRSLEERISSLRIKIHASPEQDWSVEQLAADACLSRCRFSVLYKQFFGISPAREIINARLQKAMWQLRSTSLPIKQVAANCGFDDICYFYRIFTKNTGSTPADFR